MFHGWFEGPWELVIGEYPIPWSRVLLSGLTFLAIYVWYFLKHFVFCHFHYKYDYANGILCHNSCSTSFQSLKKTPLYIYLGIFFCECIIDLSRWFWVNLLFFAKCFWVYVDKIFCIELYFLFCIINWKMYLGIKWCDTL